MSAIDTEIASLRARIAELEDSKRSPKSLEMIRDQIATRLAHNNYSNGRVRARFYDLTQLETIDGILEGFREINVRLDALERR